MYEDVCRFYVFFLLVKTASRFGIKTVNTKTAVKPLFIRAYGNFCIDSFNWFC